MRALLIATIFLVGCAPAVVAPRAPLRAKAEAPPFESKLHVVAHGWAGGSKARTKMSLCPIDGAVFVCGGHGLLPMLRGGAIVIDDAMLKGLALESTSVGTPWVGAVTGSWPGSAWLRVDDWSRNHVFYRWSADHWEKVSEARAAHAAMIPRPASPLQIVREDGEEHWIKLDAPLGGPVPHAPDGEWFYPADTDLVALGAEVFALQRQGFESHVFLLGVPTTEVPVAEGTMFTGITRARAQLVAFGVRDEEPLIEQLDDDRWKHVDVAGLHAEVRDYARDARNEWAVVDDKLYFRRDGGAFHEIDTNIVVERVWSVADDDAWVFGTKGKEGVLLRTIPPAKVTTLTN